MAALSIERRGRGVRCETALSSRPGSRRSKGKAPRSVLAAGARGALFEQRNDGLQEQVGRAERSKIRREPPRSAQVRYDAGVRAPALALSALALLLAACDDGRKASEQDAADAVQQLAPIFKEDVAQVRRGLPQGAAKLGATLDADTLGNLAALRTAISRARAEVKDLEVAKSTFFSFADSKGEVVRSEADPDVLAGKSLIAKEAFPALQKALDPAAGVVEAFGNVSDLYAVKKGTDLVWAAAAPVKDAKGQLEGVFVTGWSFRALAYHLETTAKMAVSEAAEKQGKKHAPLLYVYVVKGKTAYGAPLTPEVDAHAVEELDLPGKTAGGPYRGSLEITGRVFGVAGVKAPDLGDDVALAVVASEF
jgi:hypothetical protein